MADQTLCEWTVDEDGVWLTQCGNVFVLDGGSPDDTGMRFCCYCGQVLEQVIPEPEDDR